MKCTKCSKPVKPIVALDIDGTLGDYHGHFTEFAVRYVGRRPHEPYNGIDEMRDWASREFGISHKEFREVKLAYRQGGMKRSMPAYNGATELCHAVRAQGAELWLTTTRPYLRLDNVDPDTREWLRRQDIKYDGLLYDEFKYERLAEIIDHERVVAIVDDLYEMIDAAIVQFGPGVAIHRANAYNEDYDPPGAESYRRLTDIQQEVVERLRDWREAHEHPSDWIE